MQLAAVPFDKSVHDRSQFECGEPTLDAWLREQAGQSQRRDAARTYVVCDPSDASRIIGYYSVCMFSVGCEEAPPPVRVGAYPVPAVLLARLAVDRRYQARGVGSTLLLDALLVSAKVSKAIAARMMVVHALHEDAADYYCKQGFRRYERQPLTLYLPMQDIRETLRVARLL